VFGHEECTNKEQAADFTPGLTHAVVVSCIDDDKNKMNINPLKAFKTALASRISQDLPSIAFQTMGNSLDALTRYSDYVGRNLPLVLIDTRPLAPKLDIGRTLAGSTTQELQRAYFERAKAHLESIEGKLAEASTWNFFVGTYFRSCGDYVS